MKMTYDKKVDAMYIKFDDKATYHNTKKVTDEVMIDYSETGKVVGVEILSASKNMQLPKISESVIVQPA